MKFNPFQKLTLVIYVITIVCIMIFIVPFKSFDFNEHTICYDFIWSNRKNIDFFRFSIFILIPTIIFFLIIKFNKKYDNISIGSHNKKLLIEKNIFILYVFSILGVLIFLFISNFYNNYKINELQNQKKTLERRVKLINEKLIDNKVMDLWFIYKKDGLGFSKSLLTSFGYSEEDISKGINNKKITLVGEPLYKIKDGRLFTKSQLTFFGYSEERISIGINDNKLTLIGYTDQLVRNYNINLKNKKLLFNNIIKINKYIPQLKIFNYEEILHILISSNLILILLLFVSRPTLLFLGSIFNETK